MTLPKFKTKVFLAPMAGITDPAFRLLCQEYGAALTTTELTSIHAVTAREKDLKEFIQFSKKESPKAIQLFGSDIKLLKKAAQLVEPFFDIIDYNMGCPSPTITKNMAGAALLQKPELTEKILKTLVNSVKKPITLKMRAGVNEKNRHLFLKIAKIAEKAGVSMLTLHPRTIKQGYSGSSDWTLIKELKQSVKLPVVGNGDITTPEKAREMLIQTGCDYIMVGRSAQGNPFIFTQIMDYLKTGKYKTYTNKHKLKAFSKYLKYAKEFDIKFSIIRTHAMHFTKGSVGGRTLRENISLTKNLKQLKELLKIS